MKALKIQLVKLVTDKRVMLAALTALAVASLVYPTGMKEAPAP